MWLVVVDSWWWSILRSYWSTPENKVIFHVLMSFLHVQLVDNFTLRPSASTNELAYSSYILLVIESSTPSTGLLELHIAGYWVIYAFDWPTGATYDLLSSHPIIIIIIIINSVFCASTTTSRTDEALRSQFDNIKVILKVSFKKTFKSRGIQSLWKIISQLVLYSIVLWTWPHCTYFICASFLNMSVC